MNNTAKQLVKQLGDNKEITIMADIVHGLDYEYEQLLEENEHNKYILTEFEKWLENEAKRKKNLQEQFFEPKNIQEIAFERLNAQVTFIEGCLDKLQELKKEGKK